MFGIMAGNILLLNVLLSLWNFVNYWLNNTIFKGMFFKKFKIFSTQLQNHLR